MKKNIILLIMFSISYISYGQVGVGTSDPMATLDVTGQVTDSTVLDGVIPPRLTGDQLYSKTYTTKQEGTVVYVTTVPSSSNITGQTINVTSTGLYYFDGSVWVSTKSSSSNSSDATRFIGGTVSSTLFNPNSGKLSSQYLINQGTSTYSMGTKTGISSSVGGIIEIQGDGYTISNPSIGVFDIKFDNEFTKIYGVSSNIVDMYATSSTVPVTTTPGTRLDTRDNTQITYIDKTGFRIKTGSATGAESNRSFTFLVTGK